MKDVLAMHNASGGTIRVGATETDQMGIDPNAASALDSSTITAIVESYVVPSKVPVEHSIIELDSGRHIIDLSIPKYTVQPAVISKLGQHVGEDESQKIHFRPGDIFVRHGTSNERVGYDDLARFLGESADDERSRIQSLFGQIIQLPVGVEPVFSVPGGGVRPGPRMILDSILAQREINPSALLSGEDLLYLFINGSNFDRDEKDLLLLIRSALRKTPTLFFWMSELEHPADATPVLLTTLADRDRDKSDAGKRVLEVAALVATDEEIEQLLSGLAASDYQHFKEAAESWSSRFSTTQEFAARAQASKNLEGDWAVTLDTASIVKGSTEIATDLLSSGRPSSAQSRKLGDLGRVLFGRKLELF